MYRDPWNDDVYSCYNHFFTKRYIARRKRVDALELDWLDIEGMYRSPEVVILTELFLLHNCMFNRDIVKCKRRRYSIMFRPKFRFTHDEVRIIVMALVELKNQLISEGRYTDAVDDLLIKFVE